MSGRGRQVGEAALWSVLARGARFVLGLASSVIVVRGLGEHDYGVLSLIRTVMAFVVVIAGAGLGQSLLKFLPELKLAGDRASARALVRRVTAIQAAVWGVLVLAGVLGRGGFETFFGVEGAGVLVAAAVSLAVFELYYGVLTQILNAHYDTKRLSQAGVGSHVLFILGLLVLVPRGWGVLGVLVAAAAGHLAAVTVVFRGARSWLAGESAPSPREGIARGRLLRFSLPFGVIALLNMIVWRQSETLFLAHYRGAAETGFFDLAYRFPQTALEFIPGTVWPLIMAGFSEVYARDKGQLRNVIVKYYKVLFLLASPVCLFGVALGGRIVPLLFGEAMAPAALPAQLFFAIFTVSFFGTPLSMALYVMEKTHVNLLIYVGLAVVNVGLDYLLIPRFGIHGAIVPVAFVIVASPFVYRVALGRYVRELEIPFAFIGRCLLSSSPALLLLPVALATGNAGVLLGASLLAAGVGTLLARRIRLIGKDELDMLRSVPLPPLHRWLTFMSAGG